jgi:sterol desaturase/sphingolipid hydroxylase (fatty acid hydroxylase superfamily)
MFFPKNERLALCIAAGIFAIVGLLQFWRFLAQIPIMFGTQSIPIWLSLVVGVAALSMAFWLGAILRHHRPLV